ncbi:MAG: epoxyqueuosine reductase [Clostridia bacterium]|nr:epoxyqueuosine reductase [Clostridia bacterium]
MADKVSNIIEKLLLTQGISEYGIIDFEKLCVINPKLLRGETVKSVLVALLPYRREEFVCTDGLNAGLFARIRDYHGCFYQIAEALLPELEATVGGTVFYAADHSPIAEKDAAQKCGLGFIGRNSLLINPRYGSFVFIGCFFFTERLDERLGERRGGCGDCHRCIDACPTDAISQGVDIERCLSYISQKSRKEDGDRELLRLTKTVWGCDICQNACPYNKNAMWGGLDCFAEGFLPRISAEIIDGMDDGEYRSHAFSYRKRKVILENCLTAEGKYDKMQ